MVYTNNKILFLSLFFVLQLNSQTLKKIILKNECVNCSTNDSTNMNVLSIDNYKSDSLIINYTDGTKKIEKSDDVWGYKNKDGVFYRKHKNDFLRVEQQDSLIIYSTTTSTIKSNPVARITYKYYYFSKSLHSEVFPLEKKWLLQEFNNNNCFIEKIKHSFKWYQDYSNYDTKRKTYKIVELYKECNK